MYENRSSTATKRLGSFDIRHIETAGNVANHVHMAANADASTQKIVAPHIAACIRCAHVCERNAQPVRPAMRSLLRIKIHCSLASQRNYSVLRIADLSLWTESRRTERERVRESGSLRLPLTFGGACTLFGYRFAFVYMAKSDALLYVNAITIKFVCRREAF